MGRKKLKMELIEKTNQRNQAFKIRKECLKKKLGELTILCNIGACMFIYDPTTNKSFVWPENNPEKVRSLINSYKANTAVKRCGVSEFLVKQESISDEVVKYPTWHECIDSMNKVELRGLTDALNHKVRILKSRIRLMKMGTKEKQEQLETVDYLSTINIASPPQNYYSPQPIQIAPPPLLPYPCVINWVPLTVKSFPTIPTSQAKP